MSFEANKALVRRLIEEGVNAGRLAVLDEVVAEDFMLDDALLGRERLKQLIAQRRLSFPDWHITVEDSVAEGDRVVIHETVGGTHLGTLDSPVGALPTGRRASWSGIQIWRIAG